jgi:hypothetical protein
MDTNAIVSRLMRVVRFDASVYREVAADNNAMPQAGIIVVLAAIIAALGYLGTSLTLVLISAVASIVSFFVYAAVATGISKALFQGKTNFNEMGRTLGYAYAWYAVGILRLIPVIGGLLAWLGQIIAAIAGIIALRESAEFDTVKAVVTVVIAAIVAGIITFCATGPLMLAMGLAAAR